MNTILLNAAACRRRPRGAPHPLGGRRAFTLTELIVVLAVVSLAAIVLLPAFVEASLTPNALVCQASLRAVGVANMAYADANNDCLVPAKAIYRNGLILPNGHILSQWHWMQLLAEPAGYDLPETPWDYGDVGDIFHGCPDYDFHTASAWNPGYGAVYLLHGDYTKGTFTPGSATPPAVFNVYNDDAYSQPYDFRRRGDFALPAQQGWIGDSSDWHIGGGTGVNRVIDPYGPIYSEYPNWCYPPSDGWTFGKDPERHGDSANYLFVDGHVEYLHWSVSGNAFYNTTRLLHPGDFTGDGVVNTADYTTWADNFNWTGPAGGHPADANADGVVDTVDYVIWADHFGEQRTYEASVSQSAPLTASQQSAPAVSSEDDQPRSRRQAARLARARRRAEIQARRQARER